MAVSDYSTTASNNSTISGTNIAELCPAGNLNNAIRQLMADVRSICTDAVLSIMSKATVAEIRNALDALEARDATEAINALTPAADRLAYYTGASTASLATLTAFARTLLDDADAPTARGTLGALGYTLTGSATAGTLAILLGSTSIFRFTWKDITAAANSTTAVTYHSAFSSWSRAWSNGINTSNGAQDNGPQVLGGSETTTGCSVKSADDDALPCTVFAYGV